MPVARTPHHRHDPVLVAATVGHSVPWAGAAAVQGWEACPDCHRLRADLAAIAGALPIASTPPRPRDYRLDDAEAGRLRPAGWRGWWARIGSARDTLTRPLAAGLTTLGVTGLLVAAIPAGVGAAGAAASLPMIERATQASEDPIATKATGAGPVDAYGSPTLASPADEPGPSPFLVLSWSFVSVGGGLFALRAAAGRRAVR